MPLLEIKNLKKTYLSPDGERTLIVDIPIFLIERGEQFAIFGYSGSGKTTFLNLISGITTPDSGSIMLNGEELTLLSESDKDSRRATNIGYIYQTYNLLKQYTALENVMIATLFCNRFDRDRAIKLLEQVDLGDKADYKPDQLSFAQQHRVCVARALVNNPALVLADEPTGNLDIPTAASAAGLLQNLCERNNSALILVSHDMKILGRFEKRYKFDSLNNAVTPV